MNPRRSSQGRRASCRNVLAIITSGLHSKACARFSVWRFINWLHGRPGMRLVSHWTFSDVVWSPHGKQITSNHNKMWLLTLTEYELHRAAIGSLQGSVWATLRPLIGLYLMRPHLLRRHLQYSFDEVPDRMRRTGSATQGPDAPEQVLSALESDWRDRSFHQLRMGFGESAPE